jgi:hypothetical protein
MLVKAQLIPNKQRDQQAAGNPHGKPHDIQQGIEFLLTQTTKGDFDVVSKHGFLCLSEALESAGSLANR